MRKQIHLLLAFVIAAVSIFMTPATSSAMPSFARQTGQPCMTCHFQHIPKLNAFGRNFKLNGFTDASVDLIEDDNLSLPGPMVPLAFITKIRYMKTEARNSSGVKSGTERGEWQIPDEAVLMLAGRAGEHLGYGFELSNGKVGNAKLVFPVYKGDITAGFTLHTTDGHGPATAMELFNTGILPSQRGFESRREAFAAQKVLWNGWGGKSTGAGAYAGSDMFMVYVTAWAPYWGVEDKIDTGSDMSVYYRAAVTPTVGDWNLMFGVAGASGETKCVECEGSGATVVTSTETDMIMIDTQAQGEIGGMTLEINASWVDAGNTAPTETNRRNLWKESNAWSLAASLGITPRIGVKAGYVDYTDKSASSDIDTTSVVIGGWYAIAQNIYFMPEYSWYNDDGRENDNQLTLMLFMGF